MFDVGTMSAAFGSLKTVVELAKNASDGQVAVKISQEIASVQSKLIDVQQQALSLQEENQRLREQLQQIKAAADKENSFLFLHGVYWSTFESVSSGRDHDGEYQESQLIYRGPFCPLCKDVDSKHVHLRNQGEITPGGGRHAWWCDVHKITFEAPTMQS
jgi:hypothetical protein